MTVFVEEGELFRDKFDREWVTIGKHRVLVWDRVGPPSTFVRRAAMVIAWRLDHCHTEARLIEVWHDNKHTSQLNVAIGSDDPTDDLLGGEDGPIARALEGVFDLPFTPSVEVTVVPPGNAASDGYDRTEYIARSVSRMLAAGRDAR